MNIYITIYTKEKGKQELTEREWNEIDTSSLTYHREDGPAIEHFNGNKYWLINDKLHRIDGPAEECSNGDKHWYINGKRHREDGSAIEYSNGHKYWLINGREYSKTNYNKLLKEVDRLEPVLGLTDPRDWVRKRFERKYKDKI